MADNGLRRAVRVGAALALGLAGGPAGFGQDDPLDRAKVLRQVADQKADAHVREAIREAESLAKTDRAAAARRLKDAIHGLDVSVEISSAKRQELVALAQARLAALDGRPPAADPKAQQRQDALRRQAEAFQGEAKDVRETVAQVERLYAGNRVREAQAKVAELARKYPANPAVLALTSQGAFADRVAEARDLAREQADRFAAVLADLSRTALPPKHDMEFPKGFDEKTKRLQRLEPKLLGPEEEAILKSLETTVKGELKGAYFEDAVQGISNLIDKPIYLDKKSLEDAGLDMKRPVSVPGGVTARTALRAVLQAQGLTFIIKEKVIQVVTLDKARESLVTRAYYLGDLVAATGPFAGAVTWGPVVDYQQTQANAAGIADSIRQSVDPLAWREKGGTATVVYHPPTMSLIVRAPAEVHASLSPKFGR